ncbi:MAG: hypothetical protein AAGA54_15695 [Myxococcota bacterium]
MSAALLRLPHVSRATVGGRAQATSPSQGSASASDALVPLYEAVGPGRLLEVSGSVDGKVGSARTSTAVKLVYDAQRAGETTAWIQPRGGALYPPDLDACGIDLDALLVVHVPTPAGANPAREHPHALCKATELLLRSGAFGLVVVDFCHGTPPSGREAWQGRLLGLARQHQSRVVLLTEKPSTADSLGTLIGARVEPRRYREPGGRTRGAGSFTVEHAILKNKSGAAMHIAQEPRRGPWGMR